MDKDSRGASFLRNLSSSLSPTKPKAILVVSAHWEESVFTVNAFKNGTPLTYDYHGFPASTYAPHLTWTAPSDVPLEDRVLDLLRAEFGTEGSAKSTDSRGWDHGVFIPLKLAFPEANVPIVQVSLRGDLDFAAHLRLGKALSPLASEGVWIVGSGSTTHNLREVGQPSGWCKPYVDWIHETLLTAHEDRASSRGKMARMMDLAPQARAAHPRTEHIAPLLVAFGAAFPGDEATDLRARCIFSQTVAGSLSLDSFAFM